MKIILHVIGILLATGITYFMWTTAKNNQETLETIYYKTDTLFVIQYDTIHIENIDSVLVLNNKIDSLKSENFILKYKLNRIKEYNRIAANGNNIKYLRGWINRVLSE